MRRKSRAPIGAEQTQRPQRVDQAGHERVARADGVDHVHRPGRTRTTPASHIANAPLLAHRHRDDRRAEPRAMSAATCSRRAVRVDPPQVLVAGLDDVAPSRRAGRCGARLLLVLDQRRSHVRVELIVADEVVGVEQRRGRHGSRAPAPRRSIRCARPAAGCTSGVPASCQSMSKTYCASPLSSSVASAVGVRSASTLPETSCTPECFDVFGDAADHDRRHRCG